MKKLKIVAVLMAILMTTNVHAALQSRPGADAKKSSVAALFQALRDMEKEGGGLGLNAKFEKDSSTSKYTEVSEPNNIDTHMCKNTEWGTVAMLAKSDYGVGAKFVGWQYNSTTKIYNLDASTTHNITGVFGMNEGLAYDEYVAGGILSGFPSIMRNTGARYIDVYATGTSYSDFSRYIPGDATYETSKLMDSYSSSKQRFVTSSNPLFTRGSAPGGTGITHFDNTSAAYSSNAKGTHLVVWVGEGI